MFQYIWNFFFCEESSSCDCVGIRSEHTDRAQDLSICYKLLQKMRVHKLDAQNQIKKPKLVAKHIIKESKLVYSDAEMQTSLAMSDNLNYE